MRGVARLRLRGLRGLRGHVSTTAAAGTTPGTIAIVVHVASPRVHRRQRRIRDWVLFRKSGFLVRVRGWCILGIGRIGIRAG
jgi:hypothetical protein